jgi:hypothetical protein
MQLSHLGASLKNPTIHEQPFPLHYCGISDHQTVALAVMQLVLLEE